MDFNKVGTFKFFEKFTSWLNLKVGIQFLFLVKFDTFTVCNFNV